ncbi:MAG: sulfide/dihydroorotate dehydrogenase-like FAD/NAD-binding protein [Firmicutes bacterium]|jgi:ferredoxin--NADP+ reductase|nr:sulfide/dihydroorotate dehydrogenase-like FAD/NAD-binding protein [Candidatus Fermentithermobacillaceae bacterium]
MNEIIHKEVLTPVTKKIVVNAPFIAEKAKPGQFVMLRIREEGERIPLTIADYDAEAGTITLIYQEVGFTTAQLGQLEVNDKIMDLAGPLGLPAELPETGKVVAVGGGVGVAPLLPKCKELHRRGVNLISIIGARSKDLVILEDEMREYSDELHICTDDGSRGFKGFVSDKLKELIEQGLTMDEVIAIGPMLMMKAVCQVTEEYGIKTWVSMNPIMVDGTGMCGACRVSVGGETKFACVDGPMFDGHLVDWAEAWRRSNAYKEQEQIANERCRCGGGHDGR